MIAANLESVRQRIVRSCEKAGRSPDDVTLVCVTKEVAVPDIEEAIRLGVRDIGENRIQQAVPKHRAIGDRVTWHLVGHLQTNKARDAVRIFSLIHSLDSLKLAGEIDKEAARINKVQDVLIQVNASGEETKFGMPPGEVTEFIKEVVLYQNININGLMTIAPETKDMGLVRPCFKALKQLLGRINEQRIVGRELRILSMGMTNDFEAAIEEGSTMVRVGRAVFGS